MKNEEIRSYWNDRATKFKENARATMNEQTLRLREIKAILKYLKDGNKVLDVGCGNGYSTLVFAEKRHLTITGLDFSPEMVRYAKQNAEAFQGRNKKNSTVDFIEGDVLRLPFPAEHFDVVVSERCIQNLITWEEQRMAITNLANVLKPGGLLVMAECSFTGLDRLGRLLHSVGQEHNIEGVVPWHNLFFCDDLLVNDPTLRKLLLLLNIDHFASSYTLITRTMPSRLHFLARFVPPFGKFGYNQIFLWKRRK
jgi:ubiquinone/menaquinone biosynthesis C-methylase UbiE